MMSLVSMKRKPEKKDDDEKCCAPMETDRPDYPWGTRLNLDDEQIVALGLSDSMPGIGVRMDMAAIVEVVGVNSEQVDGKTKHRLELQVTEMALQAPGPSLHERMYGKPATAAA